MYLILPKTKHKGGGEQILHSILLLPKNIACVILQIVMVVVHSITWEITEIIRAGCGLQGTITPKYSKIMNYIPRNNDWKIVGTHYLVFWGGSELLGVI